jgi:hypothetical protein
VLGKATQPTNYSIEMELQYWNEVAGSTTRSKMQQFEQPLRFPWSGQHVVGRLEEGVEVGSRGYWGDEDIGVDAGSMRHDADDGGGGGVVGDSDGDGGGDGDGDGGGDGDGDGGGDGDGSISGHDRPAEERRAGEDEDARAWEDGGSGGGGEDNEGSGSTWLILEVLADFLLEVLF